MSDPVHINYAGTAVFLTSYLLTGSLSKSLLITVTHGATHYILNLKEKEKEGPKINLRVHPKDPPTKTAFHTGLTIYN